MIQGFCETKRRNKWQMVMVNACVFFACCDIVKGRIHGDFVVCVAMRCENVENVEKIDEGRL